MTAETHAESVTKSKGRHWPDRNGIGKGIKWVREHVHYAGDDCLIWPFSRSRGYGHLYLYKRNLRINRYMCELAHGAPPTPQHEAAHLCGNRACANPRHLAWKTSAENQADRRIHGTVSHPYWWTNGAGSKLTPEQAAEILARKGIETQAALAARFGVHETTIGQIHRGEIWRHKKLASDTNA